MDLSWWPKASVFATSGLYPGYWTPSCETWYQAHVEAISKNGAKLYTATEWRNKLKLHRPIQKLVAANIQNAELYIASPRSAMLRQDT